MRADSEVKISLWYTEVVAGAVIRGATRCLDARVETEFGDRRARSGWHTRPPRRPARDELGAIRPAASRERIPARAGKGGAAAAAVGSLKEAALRL